MTRLPQVLQQRARRHARAWTSPSDAGRRHRRGGGRARRPRPGADPAERHRAARAGDGRGAHARAGGGRRRPPGRAPWRASGRADPAGTLVPVPEPEGHHQPCAASSPSSAGRAPDATSRPPMCSTASAAVQRSLDGPDADRRRAAAAAELLEELDGLLRGTRRRARCSSATGDAGRARPTPSPRRPATGSVERRGRARRRRRRPRATRSRTPTPSLAPAQGRRCGPSPATASRPPRAVRELVGDRARSWSAIEVGTSIQQALSALDRLEVRGRDSAGLTVLVRDHGLDLDDPAVARLVAAARRGPPVPLERRAHPRGPPQLRLQGGGRDRRARRQHARPCAPTSWPTTCCAWRWPASAPSAVVLGHTRWASIGIISQPNAHPVDSLELDGVGRALRHRRPQRRRRQLRRPEGGRRAPHGRRDHHRRQGDPHPRVAPAGRGRRPHDGLPRHGGELRGLGGHRRQRGRRTPTTCCSPCGAAARRSTSGWPTAATSSPPSRTAWSS